MKGRNRPCVIDAAADGAGEIRVALRPDAGLPIGRQVARDEGTERVGVEDEPARHRGGGRRACASGAVGPPWQIEQCATALKTYSPWAITAGSVDATIAGRAIAE